MGYPIDGKRINKCVMIKQIKQYISILQLKVKAMQLITPVLQSYEGKTVSKRIETKAKEVMGQFNVYYHIGYVEHELRIHGNGIDYDNTITIRLCRNDSDRILRMDKVFEYDSWYNYQDQIDSLNEFLKNIDTYIVQWNKMIDYLEDRQKQFNDIPYPVSQSFNMRDLIR